ncbi:MAG: 5-formyltetrahydrofolate cyclo-ligase [Thaumarchaeota archaeon]|nr:MAG: 5-formyltetrahydrofolate cyclo-ligase [Nitrososphaerota archaeon]
MMKEEKDRIRYEVWRKLEELELARFPRPVYGRIPNFIGAEKAASRLLNLREYIDAGVVKVSPDSPQRYVRYRCLLDGKLLIMPTPRLKMGFMILDPSRIPKKMLERASTIRGAFRYGRITAPEDIPKIDLIVTGSVAVSRDGVRIGKGGGYGELEYAILREFGKVDEDTPIMTNVHDIQVYERLPSDPYDLTIDYIATPTGLIRVERRRARPKGILWDLLDEKKLSEIPLLRRLRKISRR